MNCLNCWGIVYKLCKIFYGFCKQALEKFLWEFVFCVCAIEKDFSAQIEWIRKKFNMSKLIFSAVVFFVVWRGLKYLINWIELWEFKTYYFSWCFDLFFRFVNILVIHMKELIIKILINDEYPKYIMFPYLYPARKYETFLIFWTKCKIKKFLASHYLFSYPTFLRCQTCNIDCNIAILRISVT